MMLMMILSVSVVLSVFVLLVLDASVFKLEDNFFVSAGASTFGVSVFEVMSVMLLDLFNDSGEIE